MLLGLGSGLGLGLAFACTPPRVHAVIRSMAAIATAVIRGPTNPSLAKGGSQQSLSLLRDSA